MASLFGAPRRRPPDDDGEDDRSGDGRSQRRRLSPEEDAASPAGTGTGTGDGWLSSFVSGAKRVFSSVLLFSSPEEAASGEEEEDDDDDDMRSDENEDVRETYGAIVPYRESKIAIGQMVMKETFSRDECDKMIELIKSRVTDSTFPEACNYGTPREIPNSNAGIGHDFTGAWRSLNRDRNFTESVPFSSLRPGSFSLGSPLQASPELCTAAVTEAKKWLEEKRQGQGLKPGDNGPCTLNTDMFSSGFNSDMGSPVDLAKTYMRSLPPWQSPFLGSQKLNASPSGGVHIYDDEGKPKYPFSSFKEMQETLCWVIDDKLVNTKEDYLSDFCANLEESRRARMGSSGGSADASRFRHYGSTSRLFENDTSIFSLATDAKVGEADQIYNGSDKVAATEPVSGCSIPVTQTEDGNNGIVDPANPAKKDNRSAPQEYHATSEGHLDKLAEGKKMSTTSVTKDATGHSGDVKAPTAEPQIGESHINSASDLRPEDAGPPIQTSMNGSTNKTSANGLLDLSNTNSGLECSGNGNPSCTYSNSAAPTTSKDLTESAANAVDVDSVENGKGTNPGVPAKRTSRPSVQRGQKRVTRSTRAKGK